MNKGKTARKNDLIEFWRVIAMLLIVRHHTYYVGIDWKYPFRLSWIYVEFFYILTGYFTFAHFQKRQESGSANEIAETSLVYTLRKFIRFAPYFVPAILAEYALEAIPNLAKGPFAVLEGLATLPTELLLLSSSYGRAHLGPIWFLSAMFLVFPLFCFLIRILPKYLVCMVTFLWPVCYYGIVGVTGKRDVPHDLLRASAALCIGVVVWFLSEQIRNRKNAGGKQDTVLVCLGNLALVFTMLVAFLNASSANRAVVVAFAAGAAALTAVPVQFPQALRGPLQFAAGLCMPAFIWQKVAATSINRFLGGLSDRPREYAFYGLTILLALISKMIVEHVQKSRKASHT